MDKKSTYIMLGIIVAAIAVFVTISLTRPHDIMTTPLATTTDWENAPAEKPAEVSATEKTVVTAKHAYINGEHIIAGEIPLPTPCHILESGATVSSDKKDMLIAFTSTVKTGDICAQVITPARFKVAAKALKTARIMATLNGQEVTLNLIEAGPNENLDNFELYIKG